jgi:hypothetical protein
MSPNLLGFRNYVNENTVNTEYLSVHGRMGIEEQNKYLYKSQF